MELGKIPPHDIEAEQAVIGSMLTDSDAVMAAVEKLREDSFYREDNKLIFEAIVNLYNRSEPIDLVTVKDELSSMVNFEKVGGFEYLSILPDKVQTTANVQKYIDMVGLNGFEKALPHHLSGGMQQRTAFARALINHPKVLLLDEPFGALDAFTRVSLQDRLIELWKSIGYTAIMVTHDVEEAVVLSQKVVVMTGRPAKVSKIFEINQDYPRNRNSIEMVELKQKILEEMHI